MDVEEIATITVRGTSEGLDEVKAGLDGVTKSQADLANQSTVTATVTETTAKKHLDASAAYDKLHNSLDATAAATAAYAQRQSLITAALNQGHISQSQASSDLDLLAQRYPKASQAAGSFNTLLDAGRGALLGYAAGIGPVGAVLGSFGPWGVAAAAGIGLVSSAFTYLDDHASSFGQQSFGLKQFADVTGLTTSQVRGLSDAGSELGLTGDQVSVSIERLTGQLDAARKGSGPLFSSISQVNGGLAVQIASTHSSSDALNLLATAYNSTADATTKAAIANAAFGRGGAAKGPLLGAIGDAGGVDAFSAATQKATGITDDLTKKTADLTAQIASLKKINDDTMAAIYAAPVLQRQLEFEQQQNKIIQGLAQTVRTNPGASFDGATGTEFGDGTFIQNAINAQQPAAPAAPAGLPGGFAANYDAAKQAIKAVNDASQQLTGTSDALATAQAKVNQAAESLALVQSTGAASTDALKSSQLSYGNSLELLAAVEKQHIAALSGAATGEEIRKQKVDEVAAAFEQGKTSAADYERALSGNTGNVLGALQDQLAVIQATSAAEQARAQAVATTNALVRQGYDATDATSIADQQRVNAQANIDKSIASQVTSLQQQQQLLASGNDPAVAAAQAYSNAMAKGASSTEAAALAAATLAANTAKAASSAVGFDSSVAGAVGFAGSSNSTGQGAFGFTANNLLGGSAPIATQAQDQMAQQEYGPGGYNYQIVHQGVGGYGASVYALAQPTDQGTVYHDIQGLLTQAEQGMDAVTLAQVQAGVAKIPNAQAIVNQFLAVGNNAANKLAQEAASQFLQQYGDTSAAAGSSTTASLLSPLYLSTSGYTGLGFAPSTVAPDTTINNGPSVDGSGYDFHAATGMDFTVPGSGPVDSVPVRGVVSPGERLIAIPPGGAPPTAPSQMQQPISLTQNIITTDPKRVADSKSQLAAAGLRAANAIRRRA
jgi:hypothetical protein